MVRGCAPCSLRRSTHHYPQWTKSAPWSVPCFAQCSTRTTQRICGDAIGRCVYLAVGAEGVLPTILYLPPFVGRRCIHGQTTARPSIRGTSFRNVSEPWNDPFSDHHGDHQILVASCIWQGICWMIHASRLFLLSWSHSQPQIQPVCSCTVCKQWRVQTTVLCPQRWSLFYLRLWVLKEVFGANGVTGARGKCGTWLSRGTRDVIHWIGTTFSNWHT